MADERLEPSLSMDIEQPLSLIIDDSRASNRVGFLWETLSIRNPISPQSLYRSMGLDLATA